MLLHWKTFFKFIYFLFCNLLGKNWVHYCALRPDLTYIKYLLFWVIKGYWQENCKKKGHRTYQKSFNLCYLFSTLYIRKKMVQNCIFLIYNFLKKMFSNRKQYMANIVCKKWILFQVEIKKKMILKLVVQSPLYQRSSCTRPADNTPY